MAERKKQARKARKPRKVKVSKAGKTSMPLAFSRRTKPRNSRPV